MDEELYCRNKEVVLYRRDGSPRWQARLKLPTGDWHRISTKKIDFDDAAKVACEKYDEIKYRSKNNLAILTKKFSSVAEATKTELQGQLDTGYGKVMYSHYIGVIDRYLIPYFGNMNIDTIDHKRLMEFDQWRVRKIGRVPKKSTINNHNSALKKVFAIALKNNWIHPYQIPDLKNQGTKAERRPNFTLEEYQHLYRFMRGWIKTGRKDATRQIRRLLRDYVLILTNTGMRHGTETVNLKWKNIDEYKDQKGRIFLRLWVNGKTGKRELIANHNVRRFLRRIQNRFDDLKGLTDKQLFQVNDYVFRTEAGEVPKDFHGAFEILLKEAGLLEDRHGRRRSLYSLRHTYATFRLSRGVDIHILANQMGTSVGMIESHYSHLIPSLNAHRIVSTKGDE